MPREQSKCTRYPPRTAQPAVTSPPARFMYQSPPAGVTKVASCAVCDLSVNVTINPDLPSNRPPSLPPSDVVQPGPQPEPEPDGAPMPNPQSKKPVSPSRLQSQCPLNQYCVYCASAALLANKANVAARAKKHTRMTSRDILQRRHCVIASRDLKGAGPGSGMDKESVSSLAKPSATAWDRLAPCCGGFRNEAGVRSRRRSARPCRSHRRGRHVVPAQR